MDFDIVSQFLLSNKPATVTETEALSNPDPDILEQAQVQFIALQGPAPKPTAGGAAAAFQISGDKEAKRVFECDSWDELRVEAAEAFEALDKHNKRRKNWRNPFEAADRIGGAVARRIEFLIELIPDGDYTRILTGTLRLLCNTAKRKEEIRGKIVEALDSLCDTISHSKAEIRLYNHDPDLKEKSEALYMAILNFVRPVVAYLDKNSALESFKAFFKQGQYGVELDQAIDAIEMASSSFEKCVSVCFQRRVRKIDSNVERLKNPIFAIFFLLATIAKDFPSQLEQLKRDLQRNMTTMPTVQLIQLPVAVPSISSQHLQQLLSTSSRQAETTSVKDDLQVARGFVPSSFNQEQIGLLMSENRFVTWLRSLASDLMIVYDEVALEGNSSLSVLSYLSALISELLRAPGMFPLTFFCGLHCSPSGVMESGQDIMRRLALQLLQCIFGNGNVGLATPCDSNTIVQGLMMNNLSTLCAVFGMLVQNVPAGIIYVIVDGAFWYATEERGEACRP
ncbi:hypothetical protein E0Z10_g9505 [Xylaria hypoxylon]|uniref:DUF7708 domain-containing protein n=1 Tax=Xylaria hypoxylon TaxID=37992 RepID=A0A4Z0YNP6_9PEZI|nr:hypothetical protein E0Z10_g9505 [Xylaria hypoxylon]